MGIIGDIQSLFIDDYESGARDTSNMKTIIIDPNDFEGLDVDLSLDGVRQGKHEVKLSDITDEHINIARQKLEEQIPGLTSDVSDQEIRQIIKLSLEEGPFSAKTEYNGEKVCLVNGIHESIEDKQQLAEFTALRKLQEIPGWEDHWERIVGVHEGAHCNQERPENFSKMEWDEQDLVVLRGEVGADQAAIKWLEDNGQHEMAQAFKDYRAIGALESSSGNHSTSIFLQNDTNPEDITVEDLIAARTFADEMFAGVGQELNITETQAQILLKSDPQKFIDTVDKLVERSEWDADYDPDANPSVQKYIEDFAGAYRRQVLEQEKTYDFDDDMSKGPAAEEKAQIAQSETKIFFDSPPPSMGGKSPTVMEATDANGVEKTQMVVDGNTPITQCFGNCVQDQPQIQNVAEVAIVPDYGVAQNDSNYDQFKFG